MKLKRAGFQRLFVALLMLSLLLTTMHQAAAEATKQGAIASQINAVHRYCYKRKTY